MLVINPISYGISVPAVIQGGGRLNPPPHLKKLSGVRFQFVSYVHLNLYSTSQNPFLAAHAAQDLQTTIQQTINYLPW